MFGCTFKNSIKILFRSTSFWMVAVIGLGYAIYMEIINCSFGQVDMNTMEMIWDTDPRYVLDFQNYISRIANVVENLTTSSSALLCVVSSAMLLMRDFGDRMFEIEKSAGCKPSVYTYGRLSALAVVNVVYHFLMVNVGVFGYIITRGGVDGLSALATFGDAIVRILILELVMGVPAVLVGICLTSFIGALAKNGIAASVGGMLYVLFYMVLGRFFVWGGGAVITFIRENLAPVPEKVFWFMYYFRTEWHQHLIEDFGVTSMDVVVSIGGFLTFAGILSAVIYYRTRTRTI